MSTALRQRDCQNELYDITPQGRKLLEKIRSSEAVRNVRGGRGNVCGKFPSRKMGRTIQFESHTVELAGIYIMEFLEEDVLEFYDQPLKIKLSYESAEGRKMAHNHTPDFFVIKTDSTGFEEWKTEEELVELSSKQPNRYKRLENGIWICPPGEKIAKEFGFYYKVRTSSEININLYNNLKFLEDYLRWEKPVIKDVNMKLILSIIEMEQGITLSRLLETAAKFDVDTDDVHTMVILNRIYIDLTKASLADQEKVHVYRDKLTADAFNVMVSNNTDCVINPNIVNIEIGSSILWDSKPWLIINTGEKVITLLAQDSDKNISLPYHIFEDYIKQGIITGFTQREDSISKEAHELFAKASIKDLDTATTRYRMIEPLLIDGSVLQNDYSDRSLRRWKAKWNQAEGLYGAGFVGLLPGKRGTARKIDEEVIESLHKYVKENYLVLSKPTRIAVYKSFKLFCEEKGLLPPSLKTFSKELKIVENINEQNLKREGPRAAYKTKDWFWTLDLKTPKHGQVPFQICHIDHTEQDIELIDSQTSKRLGRVWFTVLMDACTRRVLAIHVSFFPPNYVSAAMVLRECVRRYGRLPSAIVVDNGKEFHSKDFQTFCARYQITIKYRPPHQSRFGSVCERLFGTTNTQFVHMLSGNTQNMKNVRQVTKSINPKNLAVWNILDYYKALNRYIFEIYDNTLHPALGITPREAYAQSLIKAGGRKHKMISYTEDFIISTLPSTQKGTAKVGPGKGVKVKYIQYWCNDFKDPRIENTQIPVRYDPLNRGRAYVYVHQRWVKCISEYNDLLEGKTEMEVRMATEELRKNKKNHAKAYITGKEIAYFWRENILTEATLKKQAQARENIRLNMMITGEQDKNTQDDIHIKEDIHDLDMLQEIMIAESEDDYGTF